MADHFKSCTRCGQTVITRADVPMCRTCVALEHAPQGERLELFVPAPTQLPGQLELERERQAWADGIARRLLRERLS